MPLVNHIDAQNAFLVRNSPLPLLPGDLASKEYVDEALPKNENVITISARNSPTDFSQPHGTLRVGKSIYIGTRSNQLVCYPDYDDLSTFSSITLNNPLDSICYYEPDNYILGFIKNTNKLLVANADDITDFTLLDIPGISIEGSATVCADDTYLYANSEGIDGHIYKIRVSSWEVVSSVVWNTGAPGAHAAYLDRDKGRIYYTSLAANKACVVDTNDLVIVHTYTIPFSGITDDIAFIPEDPFPDEGFPNGNLLVCVCESRGEGNIGGLILDVDTGNYKLLDLLPGYGTYYDSVNKVIINLAISGFIEVIKKSDLVNYWDSPSAESTYLSKVFSFRYGVPNEIIQTDDGFFVTTYGTFDGGGSLMRISFHEVVNPLITKVEASLRFPLIPYGGNSGDSLTRGTNSPYDLRWSPVMGNGGGSSLVVGEIVGNTILTPDSNKTFVYFVTNQADVTLPTAVGNTCVYTFKKLTSETVNILFHGTETADGSISIPMVITNEAITFIPFGSNYGIF